MGTVQVCTKTLFHKIQICTTGHFCIKTFLHKGSLLRKDTFAQWVDFAQVTILNKSKTSFIKLIKKIKNKNWKKTTDQEGRVVVKKTEKKQTH